VFPGRNERVCIFGQPPPLCGRDDGWIEKVALNFVSSPMPTERDASRRFNNWVSGIDRRLVVKVAIPQVMRVDDILPCESRALGDPVFRTMRPDHRVATQNRAENLRIEVALDEEGRYRDR
jgi:hypothetical protein